MSFKESVAKTQFPPKADKDLLAEQAIPFFVTAISEPVTSEFPESPKRMKTVTTVYLTIGFNEEQLEKYQGLIQRSMTLGFGYGEYEGRDALIDELRNDLQEGPVDGVIVRKWGKFYSLGVAQ